MTEVVPLVAHHAGSVAKLHLAYLPTRFCGEPGCRLLAAYYRAVVRGQGACGYMIEAGQEVVGYVCGVWDPTQVRSWLFRQEWPTLIFWIGAQLAINPTLLGSFLGRFNISDQITETLMGGYELRPIVVSPAWRGSDVAAKLVTTLLADASRRRFDRVYLFTESTNRPANRFYHKMGFQQTDVFPRGGIEYVRFERALASADES